MREDGLLFAIKQGSGGGTYEDREVATGQSGSLACEATSKLYMCSLVYDAIISLPLGAKATPDILSDLQLVTIHQPMSLA